MLTEIYRDDEAIILQLKPERLLVVKDEMTLRAGGRSLDPQALKEVAEKIGKSKGAVKKLQARSVATLAGLIAPV